MAQILVVDDSAAIRNEVSAFLKQNNFTVETANDGQDGLNKLKGDPAVKLVISDVNMPNMDGLTMAEKIRSDLGNQAVHIIMLTTENDPNMKARGKAAGVKGWIVKPFNGANALGAIQKLVNG
jgi:two-component system chemotaxis response regulator CheY